MVLFLLVLRLGNGQNFIQGDYGAIETKGGRILQFVNTETGERAAISDFAKTIASERVDPRE